MQYSQVELRNRGVTLFVNTDLTPPPPYNTASFPNVEPLSPPYPPRKYMDNNNQPKLIIRYYYHILSANPV